MDSTVSVVMGTYNGAAYVQEQLLSILTQTLPPIEVIVADDGSSDDTLSIVRRLAEGSAVPITVIVNPVQLGFADNFLSASRSARGDYIAFSDQDDRWEPQKLALSVAALREHDAVYCSHAVSLMDESGRELGRTAQVVAQDTVIEPRTSDPWAARYGFTVTIERRLLHLLPLEGRGIDTYSPHKPLSHDRWAYALAWSMGKSVYLERALASYRQHPTQLYGGPRSSSYRERIHRVSAEQEDRFKFLSAVARLRATKFRGLGTPESRAAAESWATIEGFYEIRHRVYADKRLLSRLARFQDGVRRGAYGPANKLGTGVKSALLDVIFGIPGGAVRRRLALRTSEIASRLN